MNKLFPLFLLGFIIFFSYGIYEQINKKSIKSKRLECQEKTVTFEKIFNKEKIKKAKKILETKNIKIISKIEYSKYMKSNLINFYDKKKAFFDLNNILIRYYKKNYKKEKSQENLTIDFYIYENDKNDSGKKNKKAKLYAGYLVFEFILNGELIYKIQTDYMNIEGNDIKNRMDCVIKSFISLQ